MGSEQGKCVRCEEQTEVEEFDNGLLCRFCYEDLCTKAGGLTEADQALKENNG